MNIDLRATDGFLGEAVTDASERGRGKRARITAKGRFVMTQSKAAAGGPGEELEFGESSDITWSADESLRNRLAHCDAKHAKIAAEQDSGKDLGESGPSRM